MKHIKKGHAFIASTLYRGDYNGLCFSISNRSSVIGTSADDSMMIEDRYDLAPTITAPPGEFTIEGEMVATIAKRRAISECRGFVCLNLKGTESTHQVNLPGRACRYDNDTCPKGGQFGVHA